MNFFNSFFRKIAFGYRASSDSYIEHLKSIGCTIGELNKIYSPMTTLIDETRPHLLFIGNQVRITGGVKILTHDFSYSVCRPVYHDLINDHVKPTIIGNNIFLGVNSVILPGTIIEDNCIIGAGAVVSSRVTSGSVVAGNPAKTIMTLEEFYNRRKESSIKDAFDLANLWRKKKNGADPTIKEMSNFWWLFLPRSVEELKKNHIDPSLSCDNVDEIITDFLNSKPVFNGFDDFLEKSKVAYSNDPE